MSSAIMAASGPDKVVGVPELEGLQRERRSPTCMAESGHKVNIVVKNDNGRSSRSQPRQMSSTTERETESTRDDWGGERGDHHSARTPSSPGPRHSQSP